MKNAFLFLLACLLSAMDIQAQVVQMYDVDEGAKNKGGRTEIPIPTVNYDDNSVDIRCDSLVCGVAVTITDENGGVLHHSQESLSPTSTLLVVPDLPNHAKYYIEIEALDQRFYGYF